MKTLIHSTIVIVAVLLLSISCNKDKETAGILGKIIGHTNCKSSKSTSLLLTVDSLSCVDYSFDTSANKLLLKHINAGFNCCPGSLYCKVNISNDTIIIQEFESKQQCDCNCLYDLDIEIVEINSQGYVIKIIEPYCGNQEQIIFDVDFSVQEQGNYCATRNQYPWGIYNR